MSTLKKLALLSFISIFVLCSTEPPVFDGAKLNLYNCDIKNNTKLKGTPEREIYVVGHAYGKPGEGDFFPDKLINYFENNVDRKNSFVALTGDFVRINSLESFIKVKDYIDKNFEDYFISVGNHEIENSESNYYQVYKNDYYLKEFNNFLLISANFSNNNWLPREQDIKKINYSINNSNKENIILLSHQIFWLNEIENKINPNSNALLETDLNENSLWWIENIDNKNIIVISGDYGAWGNETFCYIDQNKMFIANGIGDHEKDSILKIVEYNNFFEVLEVPLN
jgi:hypothetical protein